MSVSSKEVLSNRRGGLPSPEGAADITSFFRRLGLVLAILQRYEDMTIVGLPRNIPPEEVSSLQRVAAQEFGISKALLPAYFGDDGFLSAEDLQESDYRFIISVFQRSSPDAWQSWVHEVRDDPIVSCCEGADPRIRKLLEVWDSMAGEVSE